jgi:ABC-type iron transport system FetAB ATPase subunit
MSPLLHFRNPSARIPEWSCEAGEKWILRAPTGWGKSQWLRQLALLKDADASELQWRGKPVTRAQAPLYRRHWLYVSQTPFRSPATVEEHLREVFSLTQVQDGMETFRRAMEELGLEKIDLQRRLLAELSGGELQALALIRSVSLRPEGLFLDEPTSAMDLTLRLKTETWLLAHYPGAWLWVSHDEGQVERLGKAGARMVELARSPLLGVLARGIALQRSG